MVDPELADALLGMSNLLKSVLKLFSATQTRSVLKVADTLGQNFCDVRIR